MDMDNDESAPNEEFLSRSASQPEVKAPCFIGFDPTVRHCGSEPANLHQEVLDPPGQTSRSQPAESLAEIVSRSVIQYGIQEAAYMSFCSEDQARLCSPMLSSAGTLASAEDLLPKRIRPGYQLESLETTPLGSASKKDKSRRTSSQALPPFELWRERVLRQLAEEAHGSSSDMARNLQMLSPADIARIFGLVEVETENAKQLAQDVVEEVVQEVLTSPQPAGYNAPPVPRLNLTNIKRDVDDEYDDDYDDEDFDNKVGSESVGVGHSLPKTQQINTNIPSLALTGLTGQGENEEHLENAVSHPVPPDPISVSKSRRNGSKKRLVPLAEVFKRKSRRDLSMYCDDLTLMLLKQRPRAKTGMRKSRSAVQLPPLEQKLPVGRGTTQSLQSQATSVFTGWQPQAIVHDHFHYHFHVPSGPLR
mgnify:FL=1